MINTIIMYRVHKTDIFIKPHSRRITQNSNNCCYYPEMPVDNFDYSPLDKTLNKSDNNMRSNPPRMWVNIIIDYLKHLE